MSVTTQCIKRKNNMSSLSLNEDARRTSTRKSARKMPHYLARESNEQKGGKEGRSQEVVRRNRGKKATHHPMMIAIRVLNQGRRQGGLQVVKKGGAQVNRSFKGGGAKVAKVTKPRTRVKGKKTLDYESDDFPSSSDDSTPEATMGKPSIKELLKKIKEKDKMIRSLELELSKSKVTSRMNKTKVREELKWTGEETNFAEMVNHFSWHWLFPKFKFLKDGWKEILPDKKNSFYSLLVFALHAPFDDSRRS